MAFDLPYSLLTSWYSLYTQGFLTSLADILLPRRPSLDELVVCSS